MKKRFFVSIAVAVAVVMGGCSAPAAKGPGGAIEIPVTKHVGTKKVRSLIVQAGEKEGWTMTPLGSRSIVASKYEDGKSASVVIDYGEGIVSIEKNRTTMSDSEFNDEVEDLEEAIENSLK